MARGPEGKIQDAVLKYARVKDVLYKKNEVGRYFVSAGWPDVAFYPGDEICFFMEFKAPGKGLTPLQAHQVTEIRRAGYSVFVVDDAGLGRAIIDTELKRSRS